MDRCIFTKHRSRHAINEITCGEKSLVPITQGKGRVREQSETNFYQVTVLTLSNAILLGSMRVRNSMRDARALKIAMQLLILTNPIGLNNFNFSIQKAFDMCLEGIEHLFNIRLVLEKINPAKM